MVHVAGMVEQISLWQQYCMAEVVHVILDKETKNKAETRGLTLKATPLVTYSCLHLCENHGLPQASHQLGNKHQT